MYWPSLFLSCLFINVLQLRKPRHHLRRARRSLHHAALVDEDRRAFLGVGIVQIRLTSDESLSINGAGCDETDALTIGVHDRVAVVRHAHALFIEREADDDTLAFLLARYVGVTTDEPRLVRLHIRAEAAFCDAEIASAKFAGAESHLVTVKRKSCFGSQ